MNTFLLFLGLFFLGSLFGFVFELFFRRFFSSHKWVNPGFLNGPYVPLYGFGLIILFLISNIEINAPYRDFLLIFIMSSLMIIIELITGLVFLKMRIRLWDYSNQWLNYKGVICPLFSFIWIVFSIVYYYLLHPLILNYTIFISNSITVSFFFGLFLMIFIMDVLYSYDIMNKIRFFAKEKGLVFLYESLRLSNKGKRRAFLKRGKIHEVLEEFYKNFNK